MKPSIVKRICQVSVLVIFLVLSKTAAAEYSLHIMGEWFIWNQSRDFVETGEREENFGYVYGIGAMGKWDISSRFNFKITSEMKGNKFDKDNLDSNDNVEFLMIKATADFGRKFHLNDSTSIEPYLGFGYRRWLRDVEEFESYSGYIQIWRSHFLNAGIGAEHAFSKTLKTLVNGAAIIPISSRMKRDKDGRTCMVNFEGSPSGFGEIGVNYKGFQWGLFYEGLRFPESKDTCDGFAQPKSRADMFGIKFGIAI